MKCQQRKLLFEWLQFLIVDLVIGMLLLLKCSRKLIVIMLDALLPSQWRNNCTNLRVKSSSSSSSSMQMNGEEDLDCNSQNCNSNSSEFVENVDFVRFLRAFIGYAMYQMCCICARISINQLHKPIPIHKGYVADDKNNAQKIQLSMPQTTIATHQHSYQFYSSFNCKSCQTKLFTNVDSLKQMHKPMDSVTNTDDTLSPHNV